MHRFLRRRSWAAGLLALGALSALGAQAAPLDLAYNRANTGPSYTYTLLGASVSADGQKLQLKATPVGTEPGGRITLGTYPWWVTVAGFGADKTGLARNGDRYRGTGAIAAPKRQRYTVATLVPGSSHVYQLRAVPMSGIIRGYPGAVWNGELQGTLTTDGSRGPITGANLVDFDLHIVGTQP